MVVQGNTGKTRLVPSELEFADKVGAEALYPGAEFTKEQIQNICGEFYSGIVSRINKVILEKYGRQFRYRGKRRVYEIVADPTELLERDRLSACRRLKRGMSIGVLSNIGHLPDKKRKEIRDNACRLGHVAGTLHSTRFQALPGDKRPEVPVLDVRTLENV